MEETARNSNKRTWHMLRAYVPIGVKKKEKEEEGGSGQGQKGRWHRASMALYRGEHPILKKTTMGGAEG